MVEKRTVSTWLGAIAALSLVACAPESSSVVNDIADFDRNDFNSGNTFHDLVNPNWWVDGELNSEEVEAEDQAWLDSVNAYVSKTEDSNFITEQRKLASNPAAIRKSNENLGKLLTRKRGSEVGITKDQAQSFYRHLVYQDQVRFHSRYSPNRHGARVGFCFGRAMIVHAFAKNAYYMDGEEKVSLGTLPVRKIWVTGPMGDWKHHVATMVMAKEPGVGFWVIDNYVGRIVSAQGWIDQLNSEYGDNDVMFHVSRANRFSEANKLQYFEVNLDDEWFEGFFQDFLKTNVPIIRDLGGLDIGKSPSEIRGEHEELEASQNSREAVFGGETPPTNPNPAEPGEEIM